MSLKRVASSLRNWTFYRRILTVLVDRSIRRSTSDVWRESLKAYVPWREHLTSSKAILMRLMRSSRKSKQNASECSRKTSISLTTDSTSFADLHLTTTFSGCWRLQTKPSLTLVTSFIIGERWKIQKTESRKSSLFITFHRWPCCSHCWNLNRSLSSSTKQQKVLTSVLRNSSSNRTTFKSFHSLHRWATTIQTTSFFRSRNHSLSPVSISYSSSLFNVRQLDRSRTNKFIESSRQTVSTPLFNVISLFGELVASKIQFSAFDFDRDIDVWLVQTFFVGNSRNLKPILMRPSVYETSLKSIFY